MTSMTITPQNKNWIVFIIGLLSCIQIRVIGTFSIAEVISLLALPFVGLSCLRNKQIATFMAMLVVWLLGVIISDIWNGTPQIDAIKGSFNVILFITIIPFIYWSLKDNIYRILYYAAGYGISGVLQWRFFISTGDNEYYAQVWLSYCLIGLIVYIGYYLYSIGRKIAAYIVMEGFAFWTLFNESRHLFLMISLGIVILLIIGDVKENNWQIKQRKLIRNIIPLSIVLGVAFLGVTETYTILASEGHLGERAQRKYEIQHSSKMGLASGRQDFILAIHTIAANPIFGYGSYAKDKYGLNFRLLRQIESKHYAQLLYSSTYQEMLHGHSYILGAWVYSGILGALFWIYVLGIIFKFARKYLLCYPTLTCYFVISISLMMWDILFSPFANRLNFAYFIIPMIITISNGGPVYLCKKQTHYHLNS